MKLMKKTFMVLLVGVLMLSCIGTVSFAEVVMTEFPAAPEVSQMFAQMQADASVLSDANQPLWTYKYAKGKLCAPEGNATGTDTIQLRFDGTVFTNDAEGTLGNWTSHRRQAREIHFTEADNTTQAYASSGYVMLHNAGVCFNEGQAVEFGMSFTGGADAVGMNNWDRVIPVLLTASADGAVTLNASEQNLDASKWVKPGEYFDIKILYNLDNDTYGIYINDCPVMLSLNGPADAEIGAVQIRAAGAQRQCRFKTTSCYAMSAADAAQYKQAAIDRSDELIAPEASQMFAQMQADDTVLTGANQVLWTYGYAKGLVCSTANTDTIAIRYVGGAFTNENAGTLGDWTSHRRQAREIHFTGPGGNTTQAYASSGYVMLHNEGVCFNAGQAVEFGMSFTGGNDVNGMNNWDRVIPVLLTASAEGVVTLQAWDQTLDSAGGTRTLDVSRWVKPGEYFDMKMLYDLDNDTYDIFINDRPLMLSLNAPADATIGAIQIRAAGAQRQCSFKTTSCYAMSDAQADKYMKTAWENAFNQTSESADEPIYLFVTEGGGTPDATFQDFFLENAEGKYYALECDGTTNLKIAHEYTNVASYRYVYLTADDMTQYDYDNLNFTLIKEHEVDENNAKVSGSYIKAGGKSQDPVVLCALFTEEDGAKKLEKVTPVEANNGNYEAAFEFDGTEPNGSIPKFFVWGGINKLTPLFDVASLPAIDN